MADLDTHPIEPPSQPLEYRAIGLIQGRYIPSEDNPSRGTLITPDGTELAAFMGWLQPYVDKYLDLSQEQLWVVYPKRYPTRSAMSVQLKGFKQANAGEAPPTGDGFFSIRGEVIQRDDKVGFVIVKVRRNRKAPSAKDVLIRLEGFVPPDAVGQFCEFECERDGQDLVIVDGTPIAPVTSPEARQQAAKPQRSAEASRGIQRPRKRTNNSTHQRGDIANNGTLRNNHR